MARTSKYQLANNRSSTADTWRAALYLRLSREDGDKLESESISSQKLLLCDYLTKRPDIKVVDTYSDDGYTGTNFERPDFKRMFEDIRSGRVNCVVVKDLSRFGRNYVESGKYLEVIFPTLKTRFISVNDNVDSVDNPSSINSVMIPFKNIMNDEYCRDISLKVRSSLTVKRKQGQFIGSFAPYGYQKDAADRHKLVIDEEAAVVVRLIYRLFIEGKSIAGISRYLSEAGIKNIADYKKSKGLNYRPAGKVNTAGFWSDFMVRRILTGRVYCGDMVQKKTETVSYKVQVCQTLRATDYITVLNTHQPIISREIFEKVQSLLTRDTRISQNNKNWQLGLFAGFIKCADCRRAMQKKTINQPYKNYDYYICSTYKKVSHDKCTKHTIRSDVLENTVFAVIRKYIEIAVDMDEVIEKINNSPLKNSSLGRIKQAITSSEKERAKINGIMADLYPDFKSGLIGREQYLILKDRYETQAEAIGNTLIKLNNELENQKDGYVSNLFITGLKKHKNITALSREILVEFVDNIYVCEGGGIEINFKFKDAYERALEFIDGNKTLITTPNSITASKKYSSVIDDRKTKNKTLTKQDVFG